jgi:hypothetical protein
VAVEQGTTPGAAEEQVALEELLAEFLPEFLILHYHQPAAARGRQGTELRGAKLRYNAGDHPHLQAVEEAKAGTPGSSGGREILGGRGTTDQDGTDQSTETLDVNKNEGKTNR